MTKICFHSETFNMHDIHYTITHILNMKWINVSRRHHLPTILSSECQRREKKASKISVQNIPSLSPNLSDVFS